MGTYARRSPLRFMAPVALIAFGLALLIVVSTSSGGGGDSTPSASERQKDRDLGTTAKKKKKKRAAEDGSLPTRSYTVQRGDTLGSIAEKTGIPVAKLQELNPQIDPQQLTTGQKVKLRE